MRWLTFDTCSHVAIYGRSQPGERYKTNWRTVEVQHYKEPLDGVHVYENGRIEVVRNGYRDPHWRAQFARLLDMEFLAPKRDFATKEFFTPDGAKVLKSEITAPLVLMDKDRSRVYFVKRWGGEQGKIVFYHPDAQPRNTQQIVVRCNNKARYEEKLSALKEHIALGETLNGLATNGKGGYWYWYYNQKLMSPPTDLADKDAQEFCQCIAAAKPKLTKTLAYETQDVLTFDYLIVKEK